MEVRDGLTGGRKKAHISDLTFKDGGKYIDRTTRLRTKIIEVFERHFMPIDQRCQTFMHALE
jgi:hypothetical protein